MPQVDLSQLDCFRFGERVDRLSSYVEVNDSLMPHSVAAATGCSVDEALTLLLMLHARYLVDGYVLVYHSAHPDSPVERRPISAGLPPREPYRCPECELEGIAPTDLLFDLEFYLTDHVEFTTSS